MRPHSARRFGADIHAVESLVTDLGQVLRRPCLVIGKSTVPVGTAAVLAEKLAGAALLGPPPEAGPSTAPAGHAVRDPVIVADGILSG